MLLFPGDEAPSKLPTIPYLDKLVHIGIFAACAFSLYFDYVIKKQARRPIFTIALIACGLLFFGGMVEVLQELYLNRTGSKDDFFADSIGVFLGLIMARLASKRVSTWVG